MLRAIYYLSRGQLSFIIRASSFKLINFAGILFKTTSFTFYGSSNGVAKLDSNSWLFQLTLNLTYLSPWSSPRQLRHHYLRNFVNHHLSFRISSRWKSFGDVFVARKFSQSPSFSNSIVFVQRLVFKAFFWPIRFELLSGGFRDLIFPPTSRRAIWISVVQLMALPVDCKRHGIVISS